MPSAEFTYTPTAEDLSFFADDISDTSLSFILTETDIPDGLTQRIAHRIQISNNTATDHSGKTLTIVGTDEEGKTLTETLAAPGPIGFPATTIGYFKTSEDPTIDVTIAADTFNFGFVDEFVSAPYPLDTFFLRSAVGVIVTGTINYDIEFTFSQVFRNEKVNWGWHTNTSLEGQATDISQALEKNIHALRFKANSYSAGATARFEIIQTYN